MEAAIWKTRRSVVRNSAVYPMLLQTYSAKRYEAALAVTAQATDVNMKRMSNMPGASV